MLPRHQYATDLAPLRRWRFNTPAYTAALRERIRQEPGRYTGSWGAHNLGRLLFEDEDGFLARFVAPELRADFVRVLRRHVYFFRVRRMGYGLTTYVGADGYDFGEIPVVPRAPSGAPLGVVRLLCILQGQARPPTETGAAQNPSDNSTLRVMRRAVSQIQDVFQMDVHGCVAGNARADGAPSCTRTRT